jgi:hypothetical protein
MADDVPHDVVFLDFDGVINYVCMEPQKHDCPRCDSVCPARGIAENFHRERVLRVNALLRDTRAAVVLSTSWRTAFDRATLWHALDACGFKGCVVGATARSSRDFWRVRGLEFDQEQRGHQIAMWLIEHPEVERAVILDDSPDMWVLKPLLVQTSPSTGLGDTDVVAAVNVLRGSGPQICALRSTPTSCWPT